MSDIVEIEDSANIHDMHESKDISLRDIDVSVIKSQITEQETHDATDNNKRPSRPLPRRHPHRKSAVWKIFEIDPNDNVAICQLCGIRQTFWSSTTNLRKHFMSKHPEEYAPYDTSFSSYSPNRSIVKGPKRKVGRPKGSFKRKVEEDTDDDVAEEVDDDNEDGDFKVKEVAKKEQRLSEGASIANVVERVTPLIGTFDIADDSFDTVLVVTNKIEKFTGALKKLGVSIKQHIEIDSSYHRNIIVLNTEVLPGRRLVFSPTGPLNGDFDDVRLYRDAAIKGLHRLLEAGGKRPLLICPYDNKYQTAAHVATLGILQAIYLPLKKGETYRDGERRAEMLGLWCENEATPEKTLVHISAIECARIISRDLSVCDNERMTPPYIATWLTKMFAGTSVKVSVHMDISKLHRDFPLFGAVGRAAQGYSQYQSRIIFLEYTGEEPREQTLFLVGKASIYSGASSRSGEGDDGVPRGRSGGGAVAGLFQILHMTKPAGLKVVGAILAVRNSPGPNAYCRGDIVQSRTGLRVRVGDPGMDGPLIMADMLCRFKEHALNEVKPHIISLATQSVSAVRKGAPEYTVAIDNGPAAKLMCAQKLQEAGQTLGDVIDIRTLHREDLELCKSDGINEDLHHAPPNRDLLSDVGFMIHVSGLDQPSEDSHRLIPYTHLDLDQSAGCHNQCPTGSPIAALTSHFVLPRLH